MANHISCPSCQSSLKIPDSVLGKQVKCPQCSTTLTTSSKSTPAAPKKPATAGGKRKINCPGCKQPLIVGPQAAGKTVQCPHCQKKLKIPGGAPGSAARQPQAPTAPAPGPFDNPFEFDSTPGGGSGFDGLPAPALPPTPANNPYANNPYTVPASPGMHHAAAGRQSDRTTLYIVNGLLHAIWGMVLLLGSILRSVGFVIILTSGMVQQVDTAHLAGVITGLLTGFAVGAVMLLGGIAMTRRTSLSAARTAAILSTIPCFGCVIFPFGIWACVLLFADQARRDFQF